MKILHWTCLLFAVCMMGTGFFSLAKNPDNEYVVSALLTIMGGACLTLWIAQLSTSDRIAALEKRIRQSE